VLFEACDILLGIYSETSIGPQRSSIGVNKTMLQGHWPGKDSQSLKVLQTNRRNSDA
jgi:hypothetical protein